MKDLTDKQLIEELDQAIGPTLMALVADVKSKLTLKDVVNGNVELTSQARARLALAHQLFNDVAEAQHSTDIARAWFIGSNTGPSATSPAEAIREGHFHDARASAQRMCGQEDMGD